MGVGGYNASSKANQWFPFDVLNLDFSGPLLRPLGLLEAVQKTVQIQAAKKCSFTLFLTVKCDPQIESQDRVQELRQGLRNNLNELATKDFREIFEEKYPDYPMKDMEFCSFMSLALPKSMIKHGMQYMFDTKCVERHSYVGSGHKTRMLSFIFTYEYMGMYDLGSNPGYDTLTKLYPSRVKELIEKDGVDVNELLVNDAGLKAKCEGVVEENKRLTTK